jgi:hypothetical protein
MNTGTETIILRTALTIRMQIFLTILDITQTEVTNVPVTTKTTATSAITFTITNLTD